MTPDEEKFLEELTALCHKHKMYVSGIEGVHIASMDDREHDCKFFMDQYGDIYFDHKAYRT